MNKEEIELENKPVKLTQEVKTPTLKKEKKLGSKKSHAKIYAGGRKRSIARVRLFPGNGEFTINKKSLQEYFPVLHLQHRIKSPFLLIEKEKAYNTFINVKGGGIRGQADAIALAISRALSHNDLTSQKKLRAQGLLTRDSRMVERKKYGLHKARRAPQFSKR